MFSTSELIRYSRHFNLPTFGMTQQTKLKQARVLFIGAGGLGSPGLYYLAAAGVGHIGIIDGDKVDLSNLQRQILYSIDDIGKNKAQCAQQRLLQLNPDIHIEAYPIRLNVDNAFEIIKDYDVVIEGSDNYPTRYLVNDVCFFLKKPLVFASIFQFEGQCSVFENNGEGPCYRCLYGAPPPAGLIPDCAEGGVLGILPGMLGTLQATEALKLITGMGKTLSGRLLLYHALKMEYRELPVHANPACLLCGLKMPFDQLPRYQFQACSTGIQEDEITALQLKEKINNHKPFLLLDVREPYEHQLGYIQDAVLIPLAQLPQQCEQFRKQQDIVVYCKKGGRSRKAMTFLKSAGFLHVVSLKGGIEAWAQDVDASVVVG